MPMNVDRQDTHDKLESFEKELGNGRANELPFIVRVLGYLCNAVRKINDTDFTKPEDLGEYVKWDHLKKHCSGHHSVTTNVAQKRSIWPGTWLEYVSFVTALAGFFWTVIKVTKG